MLNSPGHSSPIKLRYCHADGSWRSIEAIATNLLDDPLVEGIVINSHDITHRSTPEEDPQHSAQSYEESKSG